MNTLNKETPINLAILTLNNITNADDLRYLSAYISITLLKQNAPIRGIKYNTYPQNDALLAERLALGSLTEDELITIRMVIDLLYKLLRPSEGSGRGTIQIKSQKRSYSTLDPETGDTLYNADGTPVMRDFIYKYVYIRLYAGRGDSNHNRAKLLSLYADQGSGNTKNGGLGLGGIVAFALEAKLIQESDILDAWHNGETAYEQFISDCREKINNFIASGAAAQDNNPPEPTIPNQIESDQFSQWHPEQFEKQPMQDVFSACAAEYRARHGRPWQWGETIEFRKGHGYFAKKNIFIQRKRADAIAVMCAYVNTGIDHQASRRDGRTFKPATSEQTNIDQANFLLPSDDSIPNQNQESTPAIDPNHQAENTSPLLTPDQYDELSMFWHDGGIIKYNWRIPRQRPRRPIVNALVKFGFITDLGDNHYKISDAGRAYISENRPLLKPYEMFLK